MRAADADANSDAHTRPGCHGIAGRNGFGDAQQRFNARDSAVAGCYADAARDVIANACVQRDVNAGAESCTA